MTHIDNIIDEHCISISQFGCLYVFALVNSTQLNILRSGSLGGYAAMLLSNILKHKYSVSLVMWLGSYSHLMLVLLKGKKQFEDAVIFCLN